ncbi:hypothetical protein HHI36_000536 [Cryptolaemus montrouzieri]|uniref:Uncharacterized protein n=1 Tax=Cryptolaemus montrouzieri TaxID=559131 RepID=A0ABD2P580_9CUCU
MMYKSFSSFIISHMILQIPQSSTSKNSTSPNITQSKVTTTTPSSSSPATSTKPEPKPVECNLCHRKFKNIPALNGHMRLHGGYFKKDTDNKKAEKKDSNAPPLQTASVSVRALIEEKIINRRTTTNSQQTPKSSEESTKCSTAPPLFPLTVHSSTTSNDLDSKITSFVVPAPPQQSTEKSRRHSDAESFSNTRATSTTQQEADNLADLILKREKVAIKRATSDPGQQQLIQFQPSDSFTLTGVTYQADDGGYLSPPLQDEVFTQVQDNMLLQGVDAQQLASIQFQADTILHDENEQQLHDIALDDYASLQGESPSYQSNRSVNQDLQAVLDSPLPESLADFSTFHANSGLDISSPNYQTQSPAAYTNSPHTSIPTQSPLQSPSIRHDSPGFAYPTPPASHEAQSPCFGQNAPLPMVSPKQNDFAQVPERGVDEPPQVSSPLTAAFFTSTMSSSAAVEEALEEVLPGESIAADDIYPLSDSPDSPSPVSVNLTPSQSPLSNLPSSSASTPISNSTNTFSAPQNFINFSMSPQYTFQSQMLPNSDDPLLSSSPKDCVTRKKIELNGVPLRLISNHGLIDLNSGNFAGILVDANGEIKLIQTGNTPLQAKNFVIANTSIIQSSEVSSEEKNSPRLHRILKGVQCSTKQIIARPKQTIETRKEENNDVFLSPTTIPSSPIKVSRKRPRSETLQLPILHQSKLRASRSKPQGFTTYTPQPILSPNRYGTGLYCNIKPKQDDESCTWGTEPVPETDSTPHINVGPQFQCRIPAVSEMPDRYYRDRKHEDLLWDPGINRCIDSEVDMYLDFACCAAVPGGGRNKEYAMHLLNMCGGNIHEAMLKLMQPSPSLPSDHPLLCYQYSESDKWSVTETELFYKSLLKYDKDFHTIAQEIGTKTVKQCIQFYYIWKKVCTEEHRRIKQMREQKLSTRNIMMDLDFEDKVFPDAKLLGIVESGSPMPSQENRNFICEFTDCSASFNSRAALNGHIRIHGGTTRNSPTPSSEKRSSTTSSLCHPDSTEDYPCKICGKIFTKIKSRSAHMKSHRPMDTEPSRKREKEAPLSSCATSYDNISVPSHYNT